MTLPFQAEVSPDNSLVHCLSADHFKTLTYIVEISSMW